MATKMGNVPIFLVTLAGYEEVELPASAHCAGLEAGALSAAEEDVHAPGPGDRRSAVLREYQPAKRLPPDWLSR
jgi:hypothetical protein